MDNLRNLAFDDLNKFIKDNNKSKILENSIYDFSVNYANINQLNENIDNIYSHKLNDILSNIDSCQDIQNNYLLDAINTSNSGFVSEDGVIEKWKGGVNKTEFTKSIKEATKIRRKHIEKELSGQKETKRIN